MGNKTQEESSACGTHPKSRQWLSNDCCGWVCAILTWFFLAFASYIVYFHLLRPWKGDPFSYDHSPSINGWFHYIGFFGCIILSYWSHLKTMLTDPGAVPLEALPLDYYNQAPFTGKLQNHHEICKYCDSYKPRTAHHCSVCSRCIVRMDHHCPWANNCIGQTNHKFFILFIFYTCLACIWAISLIFSRIISCASSYQLNHETRRWVQQQEFCSNNIGNTTLLLVLLGVESFFFGMFTICMICDQCSVIYQGASHIDVHKIKKSSINNNGSSSSDNNKSWKDNISQVFGGDGHVSLSWLIPLDAKWKNPEREFGFMLPRRDLSMTSNNRMSPEPESLLTRGAEKSLDDLV